MREGGGGERGKKTIKRVDPLLGNTLTSTTCINFDQLSLFLFLSLYSRLPEVPQSEKQSSPPDDSGPFRRRGASRNLGSKRGSNSPAAPSSPHRSLRGKGPTINIQVSQGKVKKIP